MPLNTNIGMLGELENVEWVRQSLFVPNRSKAGGGADARSKDEQYAGQFSYQHLEFADTSLGGNRSMNPKPQFTKFADPNLPSLLAGLNETGNPSKTESMGMGRYYGEAIDANAQRIYMQFGVPAFNSLTNFFTSFYDPAHGDMANSGNTSSNILYSIGQFVGYVTFWSIFPELGVLSVLYGTAKAFVADIQHRPLSKFYYMKPAMPLYWSTVQTIVNAISVNMKLVAGVNQGDASRDPNKKITIKPPIDFSTLEKILPDIYLNDNGGIDIRMVANRYQRLADAHERAFDNIRNNNPDESSAAAAIAAYISQPHINYKVKDPTPIKQYMADYQSGLGTGNHLLDKLTSEAEAAATAAGGTNPTDTAVAAAANSAAAGAVSIAAADDSVGTPGPSIIANGISTLWRGLCKHLDDYSDQAIAELRDGSQFISFIVDYESHVSESFSNSTKESDISSQMNEMSRSARAKKFDFANGNVGGGVIGDLVTAGISGLADVVTGVANAWGFSGLAAIGGKAFVDIPEFWDTSSTSFPSSTYELQLRSPYGNPISVLSNVLVPYSMILAAAAPRATGRNSYTGPFLCKLWQKGRTQIQLGIITSLNVTRGAGNVGWNLNQQPLGIDVSFTVTNLSKMLYVPITTDLSITDLVGLTFFDEDTNFTDYMAILGSLGLSEQYYASSRWRLRRATAQANFNSFFSVDHLIQWGANTTVGSIVSMFARKAQL